MNKETLRVLSNEEKSKKPKVLLVGTFHMAGSIDLNQHEVDNLLTEKRQQEICEVVERLKGFNPTKITLEQVTELDEKINNKYKQYLEANLELQVNEIYQIGFRMAKELGHEKLYCIDWMERGAATKACSEVYEWVKENQPELFNEIWGEHAVDINNDQSVLEMYRCCNNISMHKRNKELYTNMARIGHVGEYIGLEWLIWWYQRNLILFSNICRLIESGEDRILVLIGSSHVYILDQLLRDSDVVELVDVNTLLYDN